VLVVGHIVPLHVEEVGGIRVRPEAGEAGVQGPDFVVARGIVHVVRWRFEAADS
jgi:hypothetical protein